jgi:hypothetical protein
MNSVPFEFDTQYGQFSDALILSDEEFVTLTQDDIDLMKQQRLASWLSIMTPIQEQSDGQ